MYIAKSALDKSARLSRGLCLVFAAVEMPFVGILGHEDNIADIADGDGVTETTICVGAGLASKGKTTSCRHEIEVRIMKTKAAI